MEDFWRDKLVLICHPEHPLAERNRVRVRDLEGEKFISFEPDLPTRKVIDRMLREQGVEIQHAMEFDNIETVKRAVEIENGISIVPETSVADETRNGSLVAVEIESFDMWRPLGRRLPAARGDLTGAKAIRRHAQGGSGERRRQKVQALSGISKSDQRNAMVLSPPAATSVVTTFCLLSATFPPSPNDRPDSKTLAARTRAGFDRGRSSLLGCGWLVHHAAKGRIYTDMARLPFNNVGMVLGTSPTNNYNNLPNQHFMHRLQTAAALYHAGRVKHLLLTGNNDSTATTNRPTCVRS